MEISFGGTLGARSRSEAVLEGARSALERPKVTEGGPQAAQELTLDHSGPILGRFQGVRSTPRIGRAESRSTFAKIDLFRFGGQLLLDLASPEASQGRSWAPSGRSLGPLARSWGVPGGPQGRPSAFLGSLLLCFGAPLGDLRAPQGRQDAPGTDLGAILARSGMGFMIFPEHFTSESACKLSFAKV